jgi:hypothetical protein
MAKKRNILFICLLGAIVLFFIFGYLTVRLVIAKPPFEEYSMPIEEYPIQMWQEWRFITVAIRSIICIVLVGTIVALIRDIKRSNTNHD